MLKRERERLVVVYFSRERLSKSKRTSTSCGTRTCYPSQSHLSAGGLEHTQLLLISPLLNYLGKTPARFTSPLPPPQTLPTASLTSPFQHNRSTPPYEPHRNHRRYFPYSGSTQNIVVEMFTSQLKMVTMEITLKQCLCYTVKPYIDRCFSCQQNFQAKVWHLFSWFEIIIVHLSIILRGKSQKSHISV